MSSRTQGSSGQTTTTSVSPRQRKDINRPLPDGGRVRDGYYSWTNPEDGTEYGLGRDRRKAIGEMLAANAHVRAKQRLSLVERIAGARSWGEWCDVFEGIVLGRPGTKSTQTVRRTQLKRLRATFPADRNAARIDTEDCAKAIDAVIAEGKRRTASVLRSYLIDCFDRMIGKGWRKDNPARLTDEVSVSVLRARLSLETFLALYERTSITWFRNGLALSLVSAQAREDVARARKTDIRDGYWCNERGKTGARIMIPLSIKLDGFPLSLGEIIRQCHSTGILSHYIIHRTEPGKQGKAVHKDLFSRTFTTELAALGLSWGDKDPPTFHEIRSLAARLYRAQGNVDAQELLGHKDPKTTATYTDGRGEWVRVRVTTG